MQGNTLQYRLPTSEAVLLSANSTVQGATTQSMSIPFHTVIKGWWHKSF